MALPRGNSFNALYKGRFIIANNFMVEDMGLEQLVEFANSKMSSWKKRKCFLMKNLIMKSLAKD